jgi:hypothetical protein
MEPGSYSDPIGEAVSHSAQRAAQLVSISVAAAQGYAIFRSRQAAIRAAEDEQERRALRDQERRNYQQARLGWAPALDPRWLAQTDLVQAARTWGAATAYSDTDIRAANAMMAAENRLRALHPYAMARYDRLRGRAVPYRCHDPIRAFSIFIVARVNRDAPLSCAR